MAIIQMPIERANIRAPTSEREIEDLNKLIRNTRRLFEEVERKLEVTGMLVETIRKIVHVHGIDALHAIKNQN